MLAAPSKFLWRFPFWNFQGGGGVAVKPPPSPSLCSCMDFTNILCTAFLYKSFARSFITYNLDLYFFWRKNIGANAALKIGWWNWLHVTRFFVALLWLTLVLSSQNSLPLSKNELYRFQTIFLLTICNVPINWRPVNTKSYFSKVY